MREEDESDEGEMLDIPEEECFSQPTTFDFKLVEADQRHQ